jgi:hypothetical protein
VEAALREAEVVVVAGEAEFMMAALLGIGG